LRAMLYEIGLGLQANDFLDEPATKDLISHMRSTLDLMDLHAAHEENHIFPKLRVEDPELVSSLELDHREIERLGATLKAVAEDTDWTRDTESRLQLGGKLCWDFNTYLAFFLKHLNYEEAEAVPATQRHFSDDELRDMRGNIIAATPPASNAEFMRWMFLSANDNELAESLIGIKSSGVPPEALEGMFAFARSVVGEERWRIMQEKAGV
jgi:hemerythrin-like domain-containing protein